MAFRLSSAAIRERDQMAEVVAISHAELAEAVEAYNGIIAEARAILAAGLLRLNNAAFLHASAIETMLHWRDDWVEEARGAYEDKSEKWQESATGTAIDTWLSAWEDVDFTGPEPYEAPELADIDDPDEPTCIADMEEAGDAPSE